MDFKSLDSWIEFLETPQNLKIDLTLDRVLKVAKALNVTDFACPAVVIGGTNGKGSCVATLEKIAIAHGKNVGAYTSPHLEGYLERVRVNDTNISESDMCSALLEVYNMAKNLNITLTYFEYTTLAALVHFKESDLDLVILEVGLGGRLDAVNVVNNSIAIVTSIGMDHCDYLGNTLPDIAKEKAGIFKKNSWAIFDSFGSCADVLERCARSQGSEIYALGRSFSINEDQEDWSWTNGQDSYLGLSITDFPVTNASLAMAAFYLLYGDSIKRELLTNTLAKIKVVGRCSKFDVDGIRYIVDVAHNELGATWLLQKMISCYGNKGFNIIFQPLKRKNWHSMLKTWKDNINKAYIVLSDNTEVASDKDLIEEMDKLGVEYKIIPSMDMVLDALSEQLSSCDEKPLAIAFGSFYLASEMLKKIRCVGWVEAS